MKEGISTNIAKHNKSVLLEWLKIQFMYKYISKITIPFQTFQAFTFKSKSLQNKTFFIIFARPSKFLLHSIFFT